MTIIEKLSDRGSFIYEAILLVLNNNVDKEHPNMSIGRLQWILFQCGVYIKKPLLMQALSVMREKGLVGKPDEKKTPTIIQP